MSFFISDEERKKNLPYDEFVPRKEKRRDTYEEERENRMYEAIGLAFLEAMKNNEQRSP